ncbi:hypothetical protein AB4Z54_58295, partial [Streptomyces sp. MCAF7]
MSLHSSRFTSRRSALIIGIFFAVVALVTFAIFFYAASADSTPGKTTPRESHSSTKSPAPSKSKYKSKSKPPKHRSHS